MEERKNTEQIHPIVSVIVPVYNEQRNVGYCINSLVSQTYPYVEVILVDDGSIDDSFAICQNYAELYPEDGKQYPRVKAISQKNQGVSAARNNGIKNATGEYLLFLDSDDVFALQAVEKLVQAAEIYEADLVCCGLCSVNFQNPSQRGLQMRIGNLFGQEVVMSGDAFRGNLMRLVAHTYMMEGVYAKLYRRDCWINRKVEFPVDMSLGEDFMANMIYYHSCNKVVMLDEMLHYYNCAPKENSLSRKYRRNRFDNQMRIMRELKKFLSYAIDTNRENEEKAEFYAYANVHVTECILEIVRAEDKLSLNEKKAELARILNDSFARELAEHTTWWKPGCEKIKRGFECYDVAAVLHMLDAEAEVAATQEMEKAIEENNAGTEETVDAELTEGAAEEKIVEMVMENSVPVVEEDQETVWRRSIADSAGKGLLNKTFRKMLRIAAIFVGESTRAKLLAFEELIYWHGLKYAFSEIGKR